MPLEISLTGWRFLRVVTDLGAGLTALLAAFWARILMPVPFTSGLLPSSRLGFIVLAIPLVLALQTPLLYFFGFYEVPHPRASQDRLRRLILATGLQVLLMAGFFFLASQTFPRSILVMFMALNIALLLTSRQLVDRLVVTPRRRAAIIGTGRRALELAREIGRYPWYGLEVVGHIPVPGESGEEGPGPRLGTVGDIGSLIREGTIDQVVICHRRSSWQIELMEDLTGGGRRTPGVLLLPDAYESLLGRTRFRSVHDIPLIEIALEREWSGHDLLKRLFDLLVASLLMILSLPVLLFASVLVGLSSPGPVFYRQERVGRHRRPFVLWKLRTMRNDAEEGTEIKSSRDDPRKTRVGAWLRATRIDEIPQLFNVLRGDMSLVGPRPERPGFVASYLEEVPGYGARFAVRPGVTGLAQVNGEYESSAENKLRYDLAYVANGSLWLDCTILLSTIRTVLTSRGV